MSSNEEKTNEIQEVETQEEEPTIEETSDIEWIDGLTQTDSVLAEGMTRELLIEPFNDDLFGDSTSGYSTFSRPPALIIAHYGSQKELLELKESKIVTTDKGADIKVIGSPYGEIKVLPAGALYLGDIYTKLRMYLSINDIEYQELQPIMKQGLIKNIPFMIEGVKHYYTVAGINGGITFLAEDLD